MPGVATVGRPKSKTPAEPKYPAMLRSTEKVADLARDVSTLRKLSVGELVSLILEPALEAMLEDELKRRLKKK